MYSFFLSVLYASQNLTNSEMESARLIPNATVGVTDTEELIAPGTPIQFDIVLPATEFLDQNRGSRYGRREVLWEERK